MGKSTINGHFPSFSIAMLVYQRVSSVIFSMSFALPWSPTMEPIHSQWRPTFSSNTPHPRHSSFHEFQVQMLQFHKIEKLQRTTIFEKSDLSIFLGLPAEFQGKSTLVYQPNWWFHDLPIFLTGFCWLSYVGLFIDVYLGIDTWCPPSCKLLYNPH